MEVVHARGGDANYVFVLNFSQEPQIITLKRPYTLLASGQPVEGSMIVPPVDAVILTERA